MYYFTRFLRMKKMQGFWRFIFSNFGKFEILREMENSLLPYCCLYVFFPNTGYKMFQLITYILNCL